MVSGVFAGDAEKLSLRSAFPVIHDLEKQYGGLFKGMMKKKNKKGGAAGPGGVLTSYKGGLINAVNDISNVCQGVRFVTSCTVENVSKRDGIFHVETDIEKFEFDYLFLCGPAYSATHFLFDLDSYLAKTLGMVPYAPAFVCGLGFDSKDIEDDLDGFGYLIPFSEHRDILGALYTSSIFPERAPAGKKLVRVIMGGDRNRKIMEKSDDEMVQVALKNIKDTLGVKNDPHMVQTFRWQKAIPQYYVGHSEIADTAEKLASEIGGFYIGGNSLRGISINDCIRQSYTIVEKFARELEG